MADESKSYREMLTRRRFAELAGVSGAAALAGCDGDSGTETPGDQDTDTPDDGDDSTPAPTDEVHDVTLVQAENNDTATISYNNYGTPSDWSIRLVYDRFAQYYFHEADFYPYAISDWEVSGEEMTLQVRDGLKWHDGDDVTAEDLKAKLDVEIATGQGTATHIESVETDGDQTVVANLVAARNPNILKHALNGRRQSMDIKYEEFSDILDQGEDAIAEEFPNMDRQEPNGTGPFQVAEVNQEHVLLERFDEHPDADLINFEQIEYINFGGNSNMQQALIGGNVDCVQSLFTPSTIVAQMPREVVEAKPEGKLGIGLLPQFEDDDMGKRGVRQGIMAALDREEITNSYPRIKNPVEVPAGLPNQEAERFLGDEIDTYNTYNDAEMVDQYMEDAGYSLDGGTWKDENGSTLTVPITTPGGWTDFIAQVQIMIDQLNDAGFDASMDQVPEAEMQDTTWPEGDYKIATAMWGPGGAQATFPYFQFEYLIENNHWPMNGSQNYPGDEVKTFPARDGNGEIEMNPAEEYVALSEQLSSDELTEITRDVAWAVNQDLPMMQIAEKTEQAFLTEDDTWSVPDEGDDLYRTRWPTTWLPHVGELRAKDQ